MIKCNLCGIEKATRREMNGHLLRSHYKEYKAGGCHQSEFTTGDPEESGGKTQHKSKSAAKTQQKIPKFPKSPAGFRLLDRNDPDEAAAYKEGYRYIDDDEICYDATEAKESGWI